METARALHARELTAEQVVEAAIDRAQANEGLGAIVTDSFDRARGQLAGGLNGPFAAVPTFIKDLAQVEGVRTAWGSAASGQHVSKRSEAIVRLFESLGFVALGKSATPELGLTGTTEPLAFSVCRNPWNHAYSTGGSSGGAAALVAAGVVPLAHASDGGGSIRIPASCCGLVGLKPSRGRLDMQASKFLPVNLACDGVVAREVGDVYAFFRAVRRPSASIDDLLLPGRDMTSLRIALFVDSPRGSEVHADNRTAVRQAGARCAALGHHVDEIGCPFPAQVMEDFYDYWKGLAWGQADWGSVLIHRGWNSSRVEPFTKALSKAFRSEWRRILTTVVPRLRRFSATYRAYFEDVDVLICPTAASPTPPLGYLSTEQPFDTAIDRIQRFVAFTPIQNVAGGPALSLPLGQCQNRLPIGVQFCAAPGQDDLLLQLGAQLQAAVPWPKRAPTIA